MLFRSYITFLAVLLRKFYITNVRPTPNFLPKSFKIRVNFIEHLLRGGVWRHKGKTQSLNTVSRQPYDAKRPFT